MSETMGFFTDVTLCIGCKACEVACKEWNELPADGYAFSGNSYTITRGGSRPARGVTSPSSNRWIAKRRSIHAG